MQTLPVALFVTLVLTGCATGEQTAITPCTEPRPNVCTREYFPVCGQLDSGDWQEYASPCNACAHDVVVAYAPGTCPEQP